MTAPSAKVGDLITLPGGGPARVIEAIDVRDMPAKRPDGKPYGLNFGVLIVEAPRRISE